MTAFSVSVPPTQRVFGIGQSDAIHHNGNSTNPIKKHHACNGEPSSSSDLNLNDHSVGLIFGGFRGSRMWYTLELVTTDGACGVTRALMGIDRSDMLRRRSVRRSGVVSMRWMELEAVLEGVRLSDWGGPLVRLGQEAVTAALDPFEAVPALE